MKQIEIVQSIVWLVTEFICNLHQTAPCRLRKCLSDAYSLSSGAVP